MRRFDGAVCWPEMHTSTHKLLHLKFNLQFIQHNSFLPLCCFIKKEGCSPEIVQSFTKKQNKQGRIVQGEFRGFLIRGFSVAISLKLRMKINPRKITLFKHKSRTEGRITCRQTCCYLEDICFSFRGRTQINSQRGEQLRQSNSGGDLEVEGFCSRFADNF